MNRLLSIMLLFIVNHAMSQVDTTYVYKTGTPFGTLDIRIAKSPTQFYYLQEDRTMSYRESSPGVRTNSFLPLTTWNSSDYTQGNLRETNGVKDNFILNYRLLFPISYNATYNPGYPIIILMHGLGERGNCWDDRCYHATRDWNYNTNTPPATTAPDNLLLNNDLNLLNGGAAHLDARNLAGSLLPDDANMPARAFPGFVLVPQNLNGWNANTVQDAIRLLRLVIKKYNIDENRVYIEGISNGGAGTFEALKRAPWLFAAALTMSPISDASIISQGQAPNVSHIPMWVFQGGRDKAPSPSYTQSNIKKLREAGASVRFNLYENLAHGTWNTAYKEPDFFSWILSKNKNQLHTYAENTAICLTNSDGVKLELAKGFFHYQWQKDGVIIDGESASSFIAKTPGNYRARFSRVQNPVEGQWNPWSSNITITEQNPSQAVIEQIGTVILPDLNGLAYAQLKSSATSDHYYWYKNGSLIDFAGEEDDTTQLAVLQNGSGTYTLVTSEYDNCPSPISTPKYIFFNNEAPINIAAPKDFKAQAVSTGSIKLHWQDVSSNENGFEIWNRKVIIKDSLYSAWQMRTLTAANITSYIDSGLEPTVTYHYKIRAVSNTGRSDYTPSATNEFLTIVTTLDDVKPAAPKNLKASLTGINTITLTWDSATDNLGIRNYRILYGDQIVTTNSAQTSFTLTNLAVNMKYVFTVQSEDEGGNISNKSNPAIASTYVKGLYYEHSTGIWNDLEEVDWSIAEFTGTINTFSIAPKTQDDYFNFKFDGYLNIKTEGSYQFSTSSSDGSIVMLDSVVVVNNDGLHDVEAVTGEEHWLSAGPKRITVEFFEFAGPESLIVSYKGPDTENTWSEIPESALISGIQSEDESFYVHVFPNPAPCDNINIEIRSEDQGPIQVEIIDDMGKSIYKQYFETNRFMNGDLISIPEKVNNGLYLVNVIHNKKSVQCKLVIK